MPKSKTLINDLREALTCLPGVGKKTAQRMTYHLLQRAKKDALNLSDVLKDVVTNTKNCKLCRNLSQDDICDLCSDDGRRNDMLCIVESPADVFNIENSTNYTGKYFVLLGDGLQIYDISVFDKTKSLIGEILDPSSSCPK